MSDRRDPWRDRGLTGRLSQPTELPLVGQGTTDPSQSTQDFDLLGGRRLKLAWQPQSLMYGLPSPTGLGLVLCLPANIQSLGYL